MTLEKSLARKIFRDALISLFIYALPVILLWGWFYYKGEKPWLNKVKDTTTTSASAKE
ncbi:MULTISPECIES: hypothetical protein [unclassified Arcicella]|uniref:hypothetical protein n=1 Tax=unclassified Arcicella TaxID=2644986 RepID=UPI002862A74D|nr:MULTISPECIES: hypothetical protein [unclassified Arcicella]MDR6562070.1 hypothetical protein [Arcicella sp. BE51]MDR6811942.1 hypothetical protein [Arcicella sp. BE140]MDR6822972.1 hypothetical protein [Arcicella sp. BE139]